MSAVSSTARGFTGDVEKIALRAIRPSAHNPRGAIEKNENYLRLTSSIDKLGVLVPIVVKKLPHAVNGIKYELVDGERRFWAAKECAKETVPAHILRPSQSLGDLRKLMFHTHMTRENWTAIAQCRALADMYPKLADGLRFSEKAEWVEKISTDTVMGTGTARDRVHVLAWPRSLKDQVYAFDDREDSKDIYSYVLAIEVSVVEQSRAVFPNFYNHGRVDSTANKVRASLLEKTITGLETGTLSSRDQIRNISPLFSSDLESGHKKTAESLFRHFVDRSDVQFDDLRAEIAAELPEALKEKPPKPQRVISMLLTIERIIRNYDRNYITESASRESTREKVLKEFRHALDATLSAIKAFRAKL
jgi:ParB-like nuclease domain